MAVASVVVASAVVLAASDAALADMVVVSVADDSMVKLPVQHHTHVFSVEIFCKRQFCHIFRNLNSGENKYPVPYFVKDAYENPSEEVFGQFTFSVWELILTRAFDKLIMFKAIPIKYICQSSCFLGINDVAMYLERLRMDGNTKYKITDYSDPYHDDEFFRSRSYLTCLEAVKADV